MLDDYLQFLEYLRYSPRDVIHFSAGTYRRLLALYNAQVFPAQLAGLALAIAATVLAMGRPAPVDAARRAQAIAAMLAFCWLWIAWVFHWRHLATIHLGGGFIAACWTLQALLLLWRGPRLRFEGGGRLGLVLVLVAALAPPIAILVAGRPWAELELVGTAPDATAIATLGLVLMARGRPAWSLLAWCLVSGATLRAMRLDLAAGLPYAAAGAALLLALGKYRSPRTADATGSVA